MTSYLSLRLVMSVLKCRPVITIKLWKTPVRTIAVASNVKENTYVKPWKEIPGPSRLPVIENLLDFLPGGSLYGRQNIWKDLYERYGPIVQIRPLLAPPMVILYDGDAVEEIYRKEHTWPARPEPHSLIYFRTYYSEFKGSKNPGSLGLAGEHDATWQKLRSLANSVLLKPTVMKNYIHGFDSVAQEMVERLKFLRSDDNMVRNFNDEMKLWSLESSSTAVIGKRLNCFDLRKRFSDDTPENKVIKYSSEVIDLMAELDAKEILWRYLPNKKLRRFIYLSQQLESLTMHCIGISKEGMNQPNKINEEQSILQKIMDIDQEAPKSLIIDVFLSGIELLPRVVMTTMYHLAKNPDKQQNARVELNTSDSKNYLKACIKESMRLLPNLSVNARITSKDYDIMGYRIPKNTTVLFAHEQMSLLEKYYPRPTEFIPERWLSNNKEDPLSYKNVNPFTYAPFGFGVRSCVGRRLTEMQLEAILEHIIKNFNIKWLGRPVELKRLYGMNYIIGNNFVLKDLLNSDNEYAEL